MGWITVAGAPAAAGAAAGTGAGAGAGAALLERLAGAVNRHDLDDLAGCFASGYRNETPAHPAQGFTGCDQVRRNWEQIFQFVPDVTAQVLRSCPDGDVMWSEWDMTGTRRDGSEHHMAGVIVFGVRGGQFSWARFYLEPVEAGGAGATETVRQRVRAEATPPATSGQPDTAEAPAAAGQPDTAQKPGAADQADAAGKPGAAGQADTAGKTGAAGQPAAAGPPAAGGLAGGARP